MPNSDSKPTPAEFLSELKSERGSTLLMEPAPRDGANDSEMNVFDLNEADDDGSVFDDEPSLADTHVAGTDGDTGIDQSQNTPPQVNDQPLPLSALNGDAELTDLFVRVNDLLGDTGLGMEAEFRPNSPQSLEETGMTFEDVERLILKFLLWKGSGTGRDICTEICLPFPLVDPLMKGLKQEQLVAFKGAAAMGDYEFTITELGRERAHRYAQECSYIGAAPVCLPDYLNAMAAQSIAKQEATEEDLKEAFSDLVLNKQILERLGPAVNSGRGMFLFGEPGNGKTSIAERIAQCFGSTIWIPRTLGIDGDIIRLFDPGLHREVEESQTDSILDGVGVDRRWVQIMRPTVIAGGELTMEQLEVVQNKQTKICEAPLQLKSNCGTLVIDDFGRQTMPIDVLLNRWIVPLEKRYDFLSLPSGKKMQVPFDQLIIFSTNLEPKDLVDGAFLRRIPYKIEIVSPTREEFVELCELIAPTLGFTFDRQAVDYLIETHYEAVNRPFRACQPRDLLLQVRNYCVYKRIPKKLTPAAFDFAVETYFSVM